MPEHFHLLITEPERGNPSTVMQVLKQRFARRLHAVAQAAAPKPTGPTEGSPRCRSCLAAPFLRLRGVERTEAGGETKIYASQPSQARTGAGTGAMGLEEFPALCLRRARAGVGQRAARRGMESARRSGKLSRVGHVQPTLRKARRVGQPSV